MNSTPLVSVIIPTRNRVDALKRCLTSLGALSYPENRLEVIVVNDCGNTVSLTRSGSTRSSRASKHVPTRRLEGAW